jgi:hypothetical protein
VWRTVYDTLGGPHWALCADSRLDPCGAGARCGGVTCNGDGRIVRVELANANLEGSLPDALFTLDQLVFLDLNVNKIGGRRH